MENSLLWMMVIFIFVGMIRKVDLLASFHRGVKEALQLFKTLFPSLLIFMLMVTLLETSGLVGWLTQRLKTIFSLQLPSSLLGLAVLRPVSSGASMAFLVDIFQQYSPDSFYGMMASLMQGATDTTLYVVSVYLSQTVGKKSGYVLPLCLGLDVLALFLAYLLTHLFF